LRSQDTFDMVAFLEQQATSLFLSQNHQEQECWVVSPGGHCAPILWSRLIAFSCVFCMPIGSLPMCVLTTTPVAKKKEIVTGSIAHVKILICTHHYVANNK
jgi:hypothetical protein